MTWRHGSRTPQLVYRQLADDPIAMFMDPVDAAVAVRAVNALPSVPMYPETRFLTLCTLEGRRGGDVTVGESGLPVVMVLSMLRSHGVAEAESCWPQLGSGELLVLERLVRDIDADARAQEDDGS